MRKIRNGLEFIKPLPDESCSALTIGTDKTFLVVAAFFELLLPEDDIQDTTLESP